MPNIKKIDLTYEDVAAHLDYEPDSGIFRWKKHHSRKVKAGKTAGTFKCTRYSRKT